ncbi:hypothetical protein M407DRAFT_33456 [Tulasnella calospora MUT 4182]|uniref:BTB domain-containing protein n=1 Tax=Tulasnella calospora MUT 4182 TaxID=1051891 RepID=A0A0C3Q309_9AGAM|nr:hypothetical protein M407DRAFT_33456 [Tulasnella calospora MUT 4182]
MSNDNTERTSFSRHPRYYGSEYLTFAVDGYLFQLPVRRLKESKYFQDMLDSKHLGGSVEGRSDEHPIALGSITSFEMESFADILDARVFDKEVKSEWKQLSAALHLSTMWEFEDIRARLIKDMSQTIGNGGIEPLDRVEVAIQCRVTDWLHPAYQELCERADGVTTDEAKRLGMDRLAAIYRVRDRRRPAAQNSGYCYSCGSDYGYTNVAPTPTLDLIKAEEVLASVDVPLPSLHAPESSDACVIRQERDKSSSEKETAGDWNGFPNQDRRSLIRRFGGYSASFQQF